MSLAPKFKWNANEKSIERIKESYLKRSLGDVQDALSHAATWGAKATLDHKIMSGTPTGSAWHYFANVRRGNAFGARVDTGEMASSVGSSKAESYGSKFMATYGLPLDGPDYFFKQEYGFKFQTWAGQTREVPGMADSRYGAQGKIDTQIRRALSKSMVARGFLRGTKDIRGERIIKRMDRGMSFSESWAFEYSNNSASAYEAYVRRAQEQVMNRQMLGDMRLNSFLERLTRIEGATAAQTYLKRLDGNR